MLCVSRCRFIKLSECAMKEGARGPPSDQQVFPHFSHARHRVMHDQKGLKDGDVCFSLPVSAGCMTSRLRLGSNAPVSETIEASTYDRDVASSNWCHLCSQDNIEPDSGVTKS